MSQAKLAELWSLNPNVRNPWTTGADASGWWIYQNFSFLLTKNWQCWYTSDGTTGPTDASDHTNRIVDATAASVRGAAAGNAQSYAVAKNADGLELMFCFQGSADNIVRVSYSLTGFTLAGVTTQQPTAADEVVISTGDDVTSGTATLDRVMTIWARDDSRGWSCILFRSGATISHLGVEEINSSCAAGIFDYPYVGYRLPSLVRASFAITTPNTLTHVHSGTAIGATGWTGIAARVFTGGSFRNIRAAGGLLFTCANSGASGSPNYQTTVSDTPALQGATGGVLMPVYWWGERASFMDGLLGYPKDWWQMVTSSYSIPAMGDFTPGYEPSDVIGVDPVRTNWLVCLGSGCIRPWKNAAITLERT